MAVKILISASRTVDPIGGGIGPAGDGVIWQRRITSPAADDDAGAHVATPATLMGSFLGTAAHMRCLQAVPPSMRAEYPAFGCCSKRAWPPRVGGRIGHRDTLARSSSPEPD
jgi:hypothetical protein